MAKELSVIELVGYQNGWNRRKVGIQPCYPFVLNLMSELLVTTMACKPEQAYKSTGGGYVEEGEIVQKVLNARCCPKLPALNLIFSRQQSNVNEVVEGGWFRIPC